MQGKGSVTVKKSFCSRLDHGSCGLLVTVEGGRVVKVEGDPECPLNRGTICAKARALPEIMYHPQRLTHPRVRAGERGEGKWRTVSWDEALSAIADKLNGIKGEFGPEALVLALGTPKGMEIAFAQRFASAFGTPNISTPGHVCHMPGELASVYTYGDATVADYNHPPALVMVWGCNPYHTNPGGFSRVGLRHALSSGSKLIVVDPRQTGLSSRADLWLKLRPGTDGPLALGMIKVIVEEELHDGDFVAGWTVGLEQLREHVKSYRLEQIAETTWVAREQIEAAARLYATSKPAAIQWGNALDHTINSFQSCRAVCMLRAISGNLDVPGGEILTTMPPLMRPGEFMLIRQLPRNQEKILGGNFKVAARSFMVPRQAVISALLEGSPYPVKAMIALGTDPLLSYSGAQEVFEALGRLDLLVVIDFFMNPTAEIADVVLPAATTLEFDEIGYYGGRYGYVVARSQVVEPPGEAWPDMKIFAELATKLGLGEYFWPDPKQALEEILKPSGLTLEEFKEKGILSGEQRYHKYQDKGFRTPSGKVELYSEQLEKMGYPPLPAYNPLPETTAEYPLVLTTLKAANFFHSSYRNIDRLRKITPQPLIYIHPDTATAAGIEEGDWVWIETGKGKVKQKASFDSALDPRVVVVSFGWWFPERGAAELYGWTESNINLLTDSAPPHEPALGSLNLRGIPCQVSKASSE